MATYISRDYLPAATGYASAKLYAPHIYELSIFLHKILGYSIVGHTGWDINTMVTTLTVTAATNASPIQITTSIPHGFSTGQSITIAGVLGNTNANGTWAIIVNGANTFTLTASNGNGTYTGGGTITAGFLNAFGLITDGYGAGINFGAGVEKEVFIPANRRKVVIGDVGKMLVLKSTSFPAKNAGCFKISAINLGNTTTIAAGSNGQSLPQATINVASTAGFPASGTIFVMTSDSTTVAQIVTYTGTTGTSFTGCSGGTGTMTTGGAVTNLNRYGIDYRSTENPPVEAINTMDWWLYEIENTISSHITNFSINNALGISNAGINTTIAAGSNGVSLPTATINVSATAPSASDPFPTPSGTIFVPTSAGTQTVTYTGTTLTSFTGCSGGTGTMSTGGVVWTNQSPIKISGASHGYATGSKITISGVLGNTAANGTWTINTTNVPTTNVNGNFTLLGSSSNGGHVVNTGISRIEGYVGDDVSYNSRIILQSPHPSGWQVRIAVEPTSGLFPNFSVTTGYQGNSLGDWTVGGSHTHLPQFLDLNVAVTANIPYSNFTTGGGRVDTTSRMTIVGDDTGQAVFCYTRTTAATANGLIIFGIPDNEPAPTPDNEDRIFSYGGIHNGQFSGSDFGHIRLKVDIVSNVAMSFKRNIPTITSLTSWATLDGTQTVSPLQSANAGDSPFTSSTEVLPIEIWAGVNCDINTNGATNPPFVYDQVFMGTCPYARNGRTNFGNFTLTTEEVTSRTVTAATNASPIQITTSVANALVTGQTVTIFGVNGNTAANGTWVVTVINNQNFTLNGSTGNGTYTSGGTVNGCPRWLHLQNGIYLAWNGTSGLNA